MENNNSNISSEKEKIPTIYINPVGTGSIDFTGCKGYLISTLEEAIAVLNDLYMKGEFEAACCLLNLAFKLAKNSDQSSEEFRRNLTKLYGFAGDILGELGKASESLKYYESYQCLKMQLQTNLFKNTQPSETIKLYQFRRFTDYALANLLNRELTLSRPSEMNDIVDSLIYAWLSSPSFGASSINKNHLAPYKESFRDYRIASLCEDRPENNEYAIQNTLMWSHYADEHRGFCIEYLFHKDDFRKDNFSELTVSRLFRIKYYNPNNSDGNTVNFDNLLDRTNLSTSDAFITKYKDWAYENEVRLLQYKPKNGALREQYKLSDKTIISAIYFGYRCPQAYINVIKKLFEHTDVKFYKMDID